MSPESIALIGVTVVSLVSIVLIGVTVVSLVAAVVVILRDASRYP